MELPCADAAGCAKEELVVYLIVQRPLVPAAVRQAGRR